MIKDSGDRTEFETGAKRDMHAGKGRMDLLPWYGIISEPGFLPVKRVAAVPGQDHCAGCWV